MSKLRRILARGSPNVSYRSKALLVHPADRRSGNLGAL